MSARAALRNGYIDATKSIGTPQEVEYRLLASVTGRINAASTREDGFVDLVAALHDNLMLWQAFAVQVADKDNQLPAQLRAQLFYLYEFVRTHTAKVIRRNATADVLIEINTAIMKGLRASQSAEGTDRCPA